MRNKKPESRLIKAIRQVFLANEHKLDDIGYSILTRGYITERQSEENRRRVLYYKPY